MSDWLASISNPVLAGALPLAGLTVVGLLLWTAGRRVLRPALAAGGLLVGAALGWTATSSLTGADIGVTLPAWSGAALAGLLLACLAALLYRLLVAAALAFVIALASPAAVLTAAEARTPPEPAVELAETPVAEAVPAADETIIDPAGPIIDEASTWLFPEPDPPAPPPADAGPDPGRATIAPLFPTDAAGRLADARGRLEPVVDRGRDWWDQVPTRLRPAVIGAALTGFVLGLLMGTIAPAFSASIVTSFGGSLLWLCAFHALLLQIGAESPFPITATPIALAIWLSVSMLGAAIQWTFRPKPADTPR
ncbi:MAG: hypothetical protein HKN62_17530 [Phycisphaerales bacterium]|nr:hypothetical protein [Phycisphaerales bacterium]